MEHKRADRSVNSFAYEPLRVQNNAAGFSPIVITAALSVLVLAAVIGLEAAQSFQTKDASGGAPYTASPQGEADFQAGFLTNTASTALDAATSSDPLSSIGANVLQQLQNAYFNMQEAGIYSSSTAQAVGASLAPYVAAGATYPAFTVQDLKTDQSTSYDRMLQYRSDLRESLAPLLKNTEPEYVVFAQYVDTKDASYLAKLSAIAKSYRDTASSTAEVVVPADAVTYHVAILNAMEEFSATLDTMAAHAGDPFASVALLRGYNQAEAHMLSSFNALTTYYKSKQP